MKNKCTMLLLFLLGAATSAFAQNDTIKVDFGNITSPSPWNNVGNPNDAQIDNLLNSYGAQTDISIAVVDSFNNINVNGTQMPNPALGFPSTATGDSFFGNTPPFGGQVQPTGAIQFSNLNLDSEYSFNIFCSRDTPENRETQFDIEGLTTDVAFLNAGNNADMVATLAVFPAADGTITITCSAGSNNVNSSSFYYLGAVLMIYPEDTTIEPVVALGQPDGGEFWQAGKAVDIKWFNTTQNPALLEYSIDDGASWIVIESDLPFIQTVYNWTVPDNPAEACLVRVTAGGLEDQSETNFTISSDGATCPIVVIGSSTAAGTGASQPNSSWVAAIEMKYIKMIPATRSSIWHWVGITLISFCPQAHLYRRA